MGIPVKLEAFEGPLDLLLHLIEKNKIDIYDIPIVEITSQYMEYIRAMEREDLNVMSEFLVMAATLLDIKCKMLLPREEQEEEEEDPRQELVEQLLEYKMYKYMSYELRDREMMGDQTLYKEPTIPEEVRDYVEPVDLDDLLGDLTLIKLNAIFQEVMKRQADKVDPVRSKFGKIEKEEVTLPDKLSYVTDYAKSHRRFSFRELLKKAEIKNPAGSNISGDPAADEGRYDHHPAGAALRRYYDRFQCRGIAIERLLEYRGDKENRRNHRGDPVCHGRFCGDWQDCGGN